jgi:hypothetical protein
MIFISFAEFVPAADAGLEYQARSSGIFTLASFGWLIWFGLVLLSPLLAKWLQGHLGDWTTGWIAAAGGVSTVAAAVRHFPMVRIGRVTPPNSRCPMEEGSASRWARQWRFPAPP